MAVAVAMPTTDPRTSASCSAAEARPCSSKGAKSSTSTESVVDPMPIPRPSGTIAAPTVQAGRPPTVTTTRPTHPTPSNAAPNATSRLRTSGRAPRTRPCTHAPALQPREATARTSPALARVRPRSRTSMSGTKVIEPLNAALSRPRESTTDGRPRRLARAPSGSSRGALRASPTSPAAARRVIGEASGACSWMASCTAPQDSATRMPRRAKRRCSLRSTSLGVIGWSPPKAARRAATRLSATSAGPSTTQKTARHDHTAANQPASGAPTSDGSTHAAEIHVKTRGRSTAG